MSDTAADDVRTIELTLHERAEVALALTGQALGLTAAFAVAHARGDAGVAATVQERIRFISDLMRKIERHVT